MNELSYDIVIIGSGAGGGTVAQELAPLCNDGVRIAVLEKGPRLRDVRLIVEVEPYVERGPVCDRCRHHEAGAQTRAEP